MKACIEGEISEITLSGRTVQGKLGRFGKNFSDASS
jgi:hypothetical protein